MEKILEILGGILLLGGSGFILLSSIGLIKMPDLYMRMSATTKTATLGVGTAVLAAGIYFMDVVVFTKAIIIISFLFLTAPVAAHMIGRAAYFDGVKLWDKSIINEIEGRYNPQQHVLYSGKYQSGDKVNYPRDKEN
jgi:multicomponent Na+:H+ antiporter subunit G